MPKLKRGMGRKNYLKSFEDMNYPPIKKRKRDKGYIRMAMEIIRKKIS